MSNDVGKVRFAALLPQGWKFDLPMGTSPTRQFEMIRQTAKELERLGFEAGWVYDHVHSFPKVKAVSVFESWTLITTLASELKKLRFGTLVTCNLFRNPALLAKISANFDVLSDGRLDFGIGAGWFEQECSAYGIPFPDVSVRIEMLREAVQIVRRMWTEQETTFKGKFYKIQQALNYPKPIQEPHPPILIGGGGEKRTLRIVAEMGDMCNLEFTDPAATKRKLQALDAHCRAIGRNSSEIVRSIHNDIVIAEDEDAVRRKAKEFHKVYVGGLFPEHDTLEDYLKLRVCGSPGQIAAQLKQYVGMGVTYFVLFFRDSVELESLRLFSREVMPHFRS